MHNSGAVGSMETNDNSGIHMDVNGELPQVDTMSSPTASVTNGGSGSSKTNIRVAVRVRPLLSSEFEYEETVSVLGDSSIAMRKGSSTRMQLSFDRVFPKESTQEQIYQMAKSNIDDVLNGYNATVFAYGQTGTGKTHTMMGIDFNRQEEDIPSEALAQTQGIPKYAKVLQNKGIIPRSVQHILEHINRTNTQVRWRIYCSYLEIYNEKIFDLLSLSSDAKQQQLEIREDKARGLYVQNLTAVLVTREADIYELMQQGAKNRSIAQTDMNERSSRSHTIFQLFIEQTPINALRDEDRFMRLSKLNLVDLAGSEKWSTFSRYKMQDRRIQELTSINQSLSTLGNCISALMQPGRTHIPYRNSKLTRLLQDSLGGNTRTFFVATVSSSILAFDETLSTLKFADRAMHVVVTTSINEIVDDSVLVKRYEKEISRLRKLLHHQIDAQLSVDNLKTENLTLRRDNERLVLYVKSGKSEILSDTSSVIDLNLPDKQMMTNEHALHQKIEILEHIEQDQKDRERELDQYHNWLHSIPVNRSGRELTLEMKDRFTLLENSIALQTKELARTKKLFLRDLKIVKAKLQEKTDDLQVAEAKIQSQQMEINRLKEELREAQSKRTSVSDFSKPSSSSKSSSNHSSNNNNNNVVKNQEQSRQTMERYEALCSSMMNRYNMIMTAFRKNMIEIVQENVDKISTVDAIEKHDAKDGMHQLVNGCVDAVNENVQDNHQEFFQSVDAILRRSLDIRTPKSNNGNTSTIHVFEPRGNSRPKPVNVKDPLYVKVKGILAEATKTEQQPLGTAVEEYCKAIVQNLGKSREFQNQLYISAMTMRNTMMRILELVQEFEDMTGSQEFQYHRRYLENVLQSVVIAVEDFEQRQQKEGPVGFKRDAVSSRVQSPPKTLNRRRAPHISVEEIIKSMDLKESAIGSRLDAQPSSDDQFSTTQRLVQNLILDEQRQMAMLDHDAGS